MASKTKLRTRVVQIHQPAKTLTLAISNKILTFHSRIVAQKNKNKRRKMVKKLKSNKLSVNWFWRPSKKTQVNRKQSFNTFKRIKPR